MGTHQHLDEAEIDRERRDTGYYLALFFLVAPVYLVAPVSWAVVIWAATNPRTYTHFSWTYHCLLACAITELLFSVYHWHLYRKLASSKPTSLPMDFAQLRTDYQRVLMAGLTTTYDANGTPDRMTLFQPLDRDDPRAVDFRYKMRTWFGGVRWSEIHTHEMRRWIYWATFNEHFTDMDSIPESHQMMLNEAFSLLQHRAAAPLPDGSNPKVKPLLLKLDPLDIMPRPLLFYSSIWAGNRFIKWWLQRYKSVRVARYRSMDYLIRIPEGWMINDGTAPILFIHGLGIGLLQYKILLSDLLDHLSDHPLLIPLQPSISQDIFHPHHLKPMSRETMVDHLAGLIGGLGWADRGVTVLSHSNGSIPHAWLLKAHPHLAKRSCFVDPIVFCLWEGDVCFNFVYKQPTTALQLLMRYFVGSELGVAYTIQRHFDWCANMLWFEDIPNGRDPNRAAFFLGGKDQIVNAARVRTYLHSHGVQKGISFTPDGRHGQALLSSSETLLQIMDWLRVKL